MVTPGSGDGDGSGVTEVRLTAWVHGRVQGVGMRWWIRARALELGLVGWARNLDDGRVEIVAEGAESACRSLLSQLRGPDAPGRVEVVVERWSAAQGVGTGFKER
jgi:acylphosphatase